MYTDQEDVADVEKMLAEMKTNGMKLSVVECNAILHLYTRKNDEVAALRFWKDMKEQGIVKDERTYLELIRFYCAKENPEKCHQLLHEMIEEGLAPTQPIYLDVIYCLARKHWYKDAMDLYEKMKHRQIKPNAVLLNLMLEIGTLTKDPKYMRNILQEMWSANIEPHPEHYEAIKNLK